MSRSQRGKGRVVSEGSATEKSIGVGKTEITGVLMSTGRGRDRLQCYEGSGANEYDQLFLEF